MGNWINWHGHPFPILILNLTVPYRWLLSTMHFHTKMIMPTCCGRRGTYTLRVSETSTYSSDWWSLGSSFAETPGTKTKKESLSDFRYVAEQNRVKAKFWCGHVALPTNLYSFWPFVFVFFRFLRLWFRKWPNFTYLLLYFTWLGPTKTERPVVLSVSYSPGAGCVCVVRNAITTRILGRSSSMKRSGYQTGYAFDR